MDDVSDRVSMLEHELRAIFVNRMQSLVAYGQHTSHASHDIDTRPHGPVPRTQTLVVVDTLTADDLKACAERLSQWHDRGLATPLLMAADEFGQSLDAFPLEFGAILADHVVVAGRNPFEGISVDPIDVRRACEIQARSHLLHLREGYLETAGRADALAVLLVRSAAPFAALLTSLARLQGITARDAGAAGRHAERALKLPSGVITEVAALAHVTEMSSADAVRIFPAYLDAAEKLVKYVDDWSAA